jgi:hypothetical protein
MDTTAYIKSHRRPVVRQPRLVRLSNPSSVIPRTPTFAPTSPSLRDCRGARADRQPARRVLRPRTGTRTALLPHPRIAMLYMDVGCDSSSPASGWSPARRSPTKEVSKSRPAGRRASSTAQLLLGRARHAHPRSHREK